jgi:hypothetical protein
MTKMAPLGCSSLPQEATIGDRSAHMSRCLQHDGFDLLNRRSDQITHAYGSLLKSDSLFAMCFLAAGAPTVPAAVCRTGAMDGVLPAVEPRAIRITLAGQF